MNKYTIQTIDHEVYQLNPVQGGEAIVVNTAHPKWETVNAAACAPEQRVVTISDKGRWNTSKDYHNYYGTATPQTTSATEVKVQLTKLSDLNIDESLFTPLLTDTIFDKFVSTEGGLLPGSNVMAAGAPGVGKTSVLLEMLAKMQQLGKKVLFISAEMSELDMARYMQRFPSWANLPILFLNNYDEQANLVIEQVLNQGWDVVLTDSYTEVNDTVKEQTGWSRGKTEKWFLNLMTAHNKGLAKKFTTFVTILQLSKGGTFVGSNKLKHLTSAMMNLQWDGKENSGRRYMEFTKNRMGEVGKKLYYSLKDGITFDESRYQRDLFNDEILAAENEAIEKEGHSFDRIFGLGAFADQEVTEASEVQEASSEE